MRGTLAACLLQLYPNMRAQLFVHSALHMHIQVLYMHKAMFTNYPQVRFGLMHEKAPS